MLQEMSNLSNARPSRTPRAVVVFEDRAGSRGLAWLRAGFRHCFCLVHRPAGWIVCDPLKSMTRLDVVADYPEPELLAHYARLGMVAIAGDCGRGIRPGSFLRPLTCVELVKRVVGLRAATVWTPYQLYRALRARGFRENGERADEGIDNLPKQG